MANAWREHVKKTMAEMKGKARGATVMLKDVLKAAGKTYKKAGKSSASAGKTRKRKTAKRGKKGGRKGKSGKKR